MKNKYTSVREDYKNTVALLARETGWSAEVTENVVGLLMRASEERACAVAEEKRQAQKNAKYLAAKKLLQNYRLLREAVESGTEHALKLLEDAQYQRLMENEESVKNQKLQSLALRAAANKVLWAQINAALDCFKTICEESNSVRVQREYSLLYERYITPREYSLDELLIKVHLERSVFFQNLHEATETIGLLLFGTENAEDFVAAQNRT